MNLARVLRTSLMLDALGMAAVLAYPRSTFTISRAYADMAAIASENAWATFFLLLGLALWVTQRRPGLAKVAVAGVAATLHVFLVLSFGHASGWVSTAEPTHGAFAFLAILLIVEDWREMRRG